MLQAESARVVDADMVDVPKDGATVGEIVLRGNNVMLGYYRDPQATAEAFRGGWFHTDDLGVMHPDGYRELKDLLTHTRYLIASFTVPDDVHFVETLPRTPTGKVMKRMLRDLHAATPD